MKEDWGVRPDQVVDTLALTGDTVDNVPGVPGIGLKTAVALLQEFGTIEDIMKNLDKVSGAKRKQNLLEHVKTVKMGRTLIKLEEDLPIEFDWEALKSDGYSTKTLKALCVECGFHRFIEELADDPTDPVEKPVWVADYRLVNTPERLAEFAEGLSAQSRFSVDSETTSTDPLHASLVGLSFSWEPGVAYYIPVRGPLGSRVLPLEQVLDAVRGPLTDPNVEKVGQNLKFEILVFRKVGIEVAGALTDTMVLSYLLESGERNHSLDQLADRLLGHEMIPITELIGKGKNQITMDLVDLPRITEYAAEDADATLRIEHLLTPRVQKEGLWKLYSELERPLISVLADMEAVGIKVDVPRLKQLSKEFSTRLDNFEAEIYELAGHKFQIGSLPQLRKVLFDELKLPTLKKTPGGEASTDSEVLEELAGRHPLPRLLIEHRQISKLKSTYLDTLPELADEAGRIHASFNQVVTATGRLSSSDPNLQNIPVRTEDGGQIRQAFVPGLPGWTLISADYSQIELRVLAHFTQDTALLRAFEENTDIHTSVAARIFKVDQADVSSNQRRMAKTVNFGVIYGISAYGLATRLRIPQAEAASFIDAYFREYASVEAFMSQTLILAQKVGYVETILGRRRAINGIKNTSGRNLNTSERTAVNAVIQGSAADLIKQAMIDVAKRLKHENCTGRLLLQIHDELVLECPEAELSKVSRIVREAMTHAIPFQVPIEVDVAAGANWLDVAQIESV